MKYGRWKKEAAALRAEYRALHRPINLRCFLPPDDPADDAFPSIQASFDWAMKHGDGVYIGPGIYRMSETAVMEGATLSSSLFLPLNADILIKDTWICAPPPAIQIRSEA